MTCVDCNDSLTRCRECERTICPLHRLGTGALSEGYFCSLGCSLVNAGMVPRPKPSIAQVPEEAVRRYGAIPVIAGIIVVVWSVVAMLLAK